MIPSNFPVCNISDTVLRRMSSSSPESMSSVKISCRMSSNCRKGTVSTTVAISDSFSSISCCGSIIFLTSSCSMLSSAPETNNPPMVSSTKSFNCPDGSMSLIPNRITLSIHLKGTLFRITDVTTSLECWAQPTDRSAFLIMSLKLSSCRSNAIWVAHTIKLVRCLDLKASLIALVIRSRCRALHVTSIMGLCPHSEWLLLGVWSPRTVFTATSDWDCTNEKNGIRNWSKIWMEIKHTVGDTALKWASSKCLYFADIYVSLMYGHLDADKHQCAYFKKNIQEYKQIWFWM